jgi:flavin reductase (DIM6/NTAB) family NADH-FMN oxidoreductase RutF
MDTKAMRRITYGLFILSAKENGRDNACIVNTLAQVTTSPNRVSLTVNKDDFTHDIILRTGEFNCSMLHTGAPFELFQHFGFQSGRDVDKFAGYSGAVRANNGIYVLPQYANAWLAGKVFQTIDLGTHSLFLADVTDCGVLGDQESMTYAFYQSNVKVTPAKTVKKGWRCRVCGYVYEGETLPPDFTCPLCHHGVDDFEPIGL